MHGKFSIWYFVGILLVIYGALILGEGIYQYVVPPSEKIVLAELHAGIWWGALMLALGVVYVTRFRPKKGVE